MTLISNTTALIAAAGQGSRTGLSYPKTLYKVEGLPILIHQMKLLSLYDSHPTIIVSPDGHDEISSTLKDYKMDAHLIIQQEPKGMGDAVLKFVDSPSYSNADNVILIWGDIPFVQEKTLKIMIESHFKNFNDFTFPTKTADYPYTFVSRDKRGNVIEIIETKESNFTPKYGEREIGLFIFNKNLVFKILNSHSDKKYSKLSGEHGFLYIISELVKSDAKIEGLNIATDLDLVSFNQLSDLKHFN